MTLDCGLVPLVLSKPIRGVVTFEGAAVDVERRADGSIDLVDALASLSGPSAKPQPTPAPSAPAGPGPDLTMKVVGGSLRIRAPELAEPLAARRMDITFHLPSEPGPLTWQVALAGPAKGDDATLRLAGQFDFRAPDASAADLSASLSGKSWPWAVNTAGVAARGRFDGQLDAKRQAGLWTLAGNPSVLGLDATGPALAGDRLRLDRVAAVCDVSQTAGAWCVRRLDLGSPVATVKTGGTLAATATPGAAAQLDARLDLAALARLLPHAFRLRDGLALNSGSANLVIELRDETEAEGRRLGIEARISDLIAQNGAREVAVRDPATLVARMVQQGGGLRVEQLAIKTGFLDATGSGDLEKGVTLSASIDLEGLERQFHDLIDFGSLDLAGQGRLSADYRRSEGKKFLGRFAAEVQSLRVKGLTTAPIARERVRIDAAATGPADNAGWPQAWNFAKVALQTEDLNAGATLGASPPNRVLRIDEVRAEMQLPPAPGTPAAEKVRLAMQGQFDPAAGTLDLFAKPGTGPEPIALGPEGLHVVGLNQGGTVSMALGLAGDVARLDRTLAAWTGAIPNGLAGGMSIKVGATLGADGGLVVGASVLSPDLTQPEAAGPGRRPVGPVALGLQANKPAGADWIDLGQLTLACRYATINAMGRLDEPAGRRLADLQGTIAPNWPALSALLAQSVEPKAAIKGEMRPFRLKGPILGANTAAILQGLDAELAIDRFEAVAFGLRVAPTPVVVRCGNRQVTIAPIETSINGGRTVLRPEVAFDPAPGTVALRLAPGSAIEGAAINDEVSRGLLAYIAPVLRDATSVKGKVSVSVDRAEFPIVSNDQGSTTLVGKVVFDNVEFDAGPFTSELLTLAGKGGPQALRLHQPIQLAIANGRVNESGLMVPLGRDARIELEGSIGFDQTLAMRARMPVTPAMLGRQRGLDQVLEGLRIGVPIGGTLSHPTLDNKAFRVGLREVGKSLLKRGGEQEVRDLLKGFVRPEPPK
jgi:translocation and assembly module TamB